MEEGVFEEIGGVEKGAEEIDEKGWLDRLHVSDDTHRFRARPDLVYRILGERKRSTTYNVLRDIVEETETKRPLARFSCTQTHTISLPAPEHAFHAAV